MPPTILSAHNLHVAYLERVILDDVGFTIHEGERVALLGANGAGKSTLLGIIAGRIAPQGGEIRARRDLLVSYLDQEGGLRDDWTVQQTVESAFARLHELERELDAIHTRLETEHEGPEAERLLERQAHIHEILHHHDHHTAEARMNEAMAALGVPPPDRLIGQLSGGERRRTALCRTLLEDSELLLLDEPTNHLDAETLDWLEEFLARFEGTVLFITHDRYFLDNVATKMIELHRGTAQTYMGNYTDYLAAKQEEAERAARAEATRQNLLRRELEWLRRQPKARTVKSKARIERAHDLMASAPIAPDPNAQLLFPPGPRLGNTLVEAHEIGYSINGRVLIKDFTFLLGAGDRVGIVGRNGLGKTTLIELLMKLREPAKGKVVHGPSVKFVYADQARKTLDPDKTVIEEVAGDAEWIQFGEQKIGFRAWLARFLFDENTAAMPIRLLSGGERNRVQLAKMLRVAGNIVVLDEPTNDLDLPTLRILEEALAGFPGCAFVVSHDRYFLNRVATHILAFRGDGRIVAVEGNYDHYRRYLDLEEAKADEQKAVAKAAAAAAPKAAPAATKKKLSFKEQRELEGMEAAIAAQEQAVAAIGAKMEDPETFAKAKKEDIAKLMADAEAAKKELERLFERWAELSERA